MNGLRALIIVSESLRWANKSLTAKSFTRRELTSRIELFRGVRVRIEAVGLRARGTMDEADGTQSAALTIRASSGYETHIDL